MLAKLDFCHVWVNIHALNLLLFPSLLLSSNFSLALIFLSTALSITLLALLLELEAGFNASEVLLLLLRFANITFLLGFLGLAEPVDILEETLLDFVFDHLTVKLFLGLILSGALLLNLSDEVFLLAGDAVKFLLVRGSIDSENTLFLLYTVNLLADALEHFVDFGKVAALGFLLFAQRLNLFFELVALLKSGLGVLDLFHFADELAFVVVAKSVGGEAALELLEALFKLVEGVVNLVAGLGKLVALSVDIVDISVDFFTFGENITLLVVPFFKAVEVAAEFLANTALSLLATA